MRKLFSAQCWILVFLSLYVTVAHAQDSVPTHPVDGTFIKEWLVLGPFFPEDLETDFLASVNGEASVNPLLAAMMGSWFFSTIKGYTRK